MNVNEGITGWKGFIGYHLNNALPNAILFEGNLHNLAECRRFVKACDRIYHLAGKNREPDDGKILMNNLVATGNLILAMAMENVHPEIIFASSSQVSLNDRSEYALTKRIEEDMIRSSLRFIFYRISNVYGPKGRPFYNSVVATFCHQISLGIPLTINNPDSEREFVFVGDVVDEFVSTKRIGPGGAGKKHIRGENLTVGQIAHFLTDGLGEHKNLEKTLKWYKENINVSSPHQ